MDESKTPMTPERARELLQRERARIEHALADLRRTKLTELEDNQANTDSPEDEAGLLEEVEIDDALYRQLRAELEAIERAEPRVEEGTFGLSIESGEAIPAGRLEAIPWAERTAAEQERYERGS